MLQCIAVYCRVLQLVELKTRRFDEHAVELCGAQLFEIHCFTYNVWQCVAVDYCRL